MSRNVFADLGFADDRAAEMALRVAVAVQIKKVIAQRGLSQEDAKRLFGVPQPTISKVTRLRLDGLSLALLMRMLFTAGLSFRISSEGSSQTINAQVGEPTAATSVVREWNPEQNLQEEARNAHFDPTAKQSDKSMETWRPTPKEMN